MAAATMTRRPRRTRKTAASTAERAAKVDTLRDRLEQWQGEVDDETIAEALARFDGYSDRNATLIAMQCPEATDVDGFKAWLGRDRCVRKGEHGIQILAPAGSARAGKDADAPGEVVAEWTAPDADPDAPGMELTSKQPRMRFRLAYVFDVSQTESLEERDARLAAEAAGLDEEDEG